MVQADTTVGRIRRRLWPIPSWLLSIVLHAALLVALGLTIHAAPRGAAPEATREVGIALARVNEAGQQFFESQGDSPARESVPQTASDDHPLMDIVGQRSPVDLRDALPTGRDLIGVGAVESGANPSATGLLSGPRANTNLKGGFARTQVYGITGQGNKFVYVFDRSASMGGGGNSPLRAAKAELISSLDSLGPANQFQIIFYNEEPRIFSPSGVAGRLVFADDASKRKAREFVGGIIADGGTRHYEALEMALRLSPDVIFFLTDADQPGLSTNQLLRVRQKNDHASINCIEFGEGPKLGGDNFLHALARENSGQYVYIDIAAFHK